MQQALSREVRNGPGKYADLCFLCPPHQGAACIASRLHSNGEEEGKDTTYGVPSMYVDFR